MRARGSSLRTGLVDATGWFYIADALVWAVILVNIPLPWLNLRAYSAQRRVLGHSSKSTARQEGIFEEDTISLAVELQNQSFIPQFLVTLVEHCPLAHQMREPEAS